MRLHLRSTMAAAVLMLAAGLVQAQDKAQVIAVNYPLQYIAERLMGEDANVVLPVPDGVDPSFWRPSISDISTVQSADLILLNGAGFATWTAKVSLPRSKVVDTSRGLQDRLIATASITHSHGDGGEHSHEGTASYTWLDPMMALAQAEAVADAIKARGLSDAATVDANLASLSDDLTAMDDAARAALSEAPDTVFIATHPRYQYLARAYGLTILSLEWEASAMPSAAEISDLRALAEQIDASVLIWEAEPPAEAHDIVSDLGLEDVVFPPLAMQAADQGLLEVFSRSVEAMADAAASAGSG